MKETNVSDRVITAPEATRLTLGIGDVEARRLVANGGHHPAGRVTGCTSTKPSHSCHEELTLSPHDRAIRKNPAREPPSRLRVGCPCSLRAARLSVGCFAAG